MLIILSFANESERFKFEYIYDHYKKLLLYKAYGILKDYSLAEDAVNEAFIRIYKNLHKIEDCESNMTISFVVTIVKNISLTFLKNENKKRFDTLEEYEEKDNFNLEDFVVGETNKNEMLFVIDSLKEELKSPFLLKYAHDLSHREIANMLKISENNVTVRIHRAKKQIIKLLQKEGYVYGK